GPRHHDRLTRRTFADPDPPADTPRAVASGRRGGRDLRIRERDPDPRTPVGGRGQAWGWPVEALVPPSTVSTAPVMYAASSLARKRTAGATSSGRPGRPSAMRFTNGASASSERPTPCVMSVRV